MTAKDKGKVCISRLISAVFIQRHDQLLSFIRLQGIPEQVPELQQAIILHHNGDTGQSASCYNPEKHLIIPPVSALEERSDLISNEAVRCYLKLSVQVVLRCVF
jgi:hypothetical protein